MQKTTTFVLILICKDQNSSLEIKLDLFLQFHSTGTIQLKN
uniref:Uncharacterized protein n=1 Tax=Rhizophora mucronata TaxID=61149 RepID=A0A2P2N5R0_RHIMU